MECKFLGVGLLFFSFFGASDSSLNINFDIASDFVSEHMDRGPCKSSGSVHNGLTPLDRSTHLCKTVDAVT